MSNKLTTITIILLIIAPIIGIFLWVDYQSQNPEKTEDKVEVVEEESTSLEDGSSIQEQDFDHTEYTYSEDYTDCPGCEIGEKEEDRSIQELKQAGWIPPWDYNNGVNSLKNFETEFHSISPVTFSVHPDGTLEPRLDTNLKELRGVTSYKNIEIIPTISNFDSDTMKQILNDEENRQRHINSILEAVEKNDYDGIDLDYESIYRESKEPFLNFLKDLSIELNKKDKILSVTVLPKWGDDIIYTSLAETREVQDYEKIGEYADQVRIMTYDFTHPRDAKPGPIAPTNWIEKVLDYATQKIQNEKIWLGVHLYSYEWVLEDENNYANILDVNSYTYQQLKNGILTKDDITTTYDKEIEEGVAEYPCNGDHCKLYYATPQSVAQRHNLANEYQIAGVTYWRLGQEGDIIK